MSSRRTRRRLGGLATDTSGTNAIETALVAPIVLMLVLGLIQLGWALHCAASVRWALESNARKLLIDPTVSASTLQQAMVTQLSGVADSSNLTVTVTPDNTNPQAKLVVAQSVYNQNLSIAFLPSWNLRFQNTVAVPTT